MSNKSSLRYLVVLLFAAFATAALVVADVGALGQNTNSSTTTANTSAQNDDTTTGDVSGDQTDLSGAYTGNVMMTGGHEMSGQGTLTITGNQFTLESEGMSHTGRVYAVTTRGYTGAAFYFSDLKDSMTNTPVVANVRARKSGERLTLAPVPGSRTRLTFGAGGGSRGRRRASRPAAATEMNANTGEAMNSNTTPPR